MIRLAFNISGFEGGGLVPSIHCDSGFDGFMTMESVSRGYFDVPFGQFGQFTVHFDEQEVRSNVPPINDGSALEAGLLDPPIGELKFRPKHLPVVSVNGLSLVANGQRWTYNGATHFLALERLILGDVNSVVDYAGANTYRVFGTCAAISGQAGLPPLDPDNFPTYFDRLDVLADELARRRRYLHFCALADLAALGKDKQWAQRFVSMCVDVLRPKTNVLFSLGNEPWNKAFNGWDYDWIPVRPDLPFYCSRGSIADEAGSYGYDGLGVTWDATEVHPRRDMPKFFSHQMLASVAFDRQLAIIVDESVKFGTVPIFSKQYNDPAIARIVGESGRALNGIGFHSPEGCFSIPLEPQTDACRAAFFE